MRFARGATIGVFSLSVLAACGERALLPSTDVAAVRAPEAGKVDGHGHLRPASPYFCTAVRRTKRGTSPYEYGEIRLTFPREELAANGSAVTMRIRSYADGTELVYGANCTLPNSEAAISRVERRFGVSRYAHPARRGEASEAGVSFATAVMEGISVNACRYGGIYPYCEPEPLPPMQAAVQINCGPDDPTCGTSSGWDWSAGGDSPDPPPVDDGTERPPCQRAADGSCITRLPSSAEWDRLIALIAAIKPNNEACIGAKAELQALASEGRSSGRLRLWDGFDIIKPDSQRLGENRVDSSGRYIEWDSYWVFRDSRLIVHEGLHAYYDRIFNQNAGLISPPGETYVRSFEKTCR
jgi:hypothetical protein